MEGVIRYDVEPAERNLLITFDDRVTTPDKIKGRLGARGYNIPGVAAGDPSKFCP